MTDTPLSASALRAIDDVAALPSGLPPAVIAMWHLARGDWEHAHALAQDVRTPDGAWVHAHLHRVEGDEGNAAYWYARAGRPVSQVALDDEWVAITTALLARE